MQFLNVKGKIAILALLLSVSGTFHTFASTTVYKPSNGFLFTDCSTSSSPPSGLGISSTYFNTAYDTSGTEYQNFPCTTTHTTDGQASNFPYIATTTIPLDGSINYMWIIMEGRVSDTVGYVSAGSNDPGNSYTIDISGRSTDVNYFMVDGHKIEAMRVAIPSECNFGTCPVFTGGVDISLYPNRSYSTSNLYRFYGIITTTDSALNITDEASMISALGTSPAPPSDTSTHIISFDPQEGAVVASGTPVTFDINAYINPDDVGTFSGVRITLQNIDQNQMISGFVPNITMVLYKNVTNTSGTFSFSTSTYLASGNYRINAKLERSLVFGYGTNPFSTINTDQSHQFIVGTGTFIGNITQNSYKEVNTILNGYSATSTASLATKCNLLDNFDTIQCISFLFVPSYDQVQGIFESLKESFLTRAPWGYVTRFVSILSSTATSSLPTYTVNMPITANSAIPMTFDMQDMLVGGTAQLNSISSNIEHKSVRDVFEPFVKLLLAIAVIFTIIMDILGSHNHDMGDSKNVKYRT